MTPSPPTMAEQNTEVVEWDDHYVDIRGADVLCSQHNAVVSNLRAALADVENYKRQAISANKVATDALREARRQEERARAAELKLSMVPL